MNQFKNKLFFFFLIQKSRKKIIYHKRQVYFSTSLSSLLSLNTNNLLTFQPQHFPVLESIICKVTGFLIPHFLKKHKIYNIVQYMFIERQFQGFFWVFFFEFSAKQNCFILGIGIHNCHMIKGDVRPSCTFENTNENIS